MTNERSPFFHLTIREWVLVILMIMLIGVAVYTARLNHSAFGLLNISPANYQAVVTHFGEEIFTQESVLTLSLDNQPKRQQQQSVVSVDPAVPAPIADFTALNTRVGKEIALFWTAPPSPHTVNIYRRIDSPSASVNESNTEDMVVEHSQNSSFIDHNVTNGTTYRYRIVAVSNSAGAEYMSSEKSATATPADTLSPQPPSGITIESQTTASAPALYIVWTHPKESDFDHVTIFRSTQFGVSGEAIATRSASEPSEYTDAAIQANTTYYYTLVAYDSAGNPSADMSAVPSPGNSQPFTPLP